MVKNAAMPIGQVEGTLGGQRRSGQVPIRQLLTSLYSYTQQIAFPIINEKQCDVRLGNLFLRALNPLKIRC